MIDVSILCAKEQSKLAQKLVRRLEESNLRCWIASRDEKQIAYPDALQESNSVLLVYTDNSDTSELIMEQYDMADEQGKPIIVYQAGDVRDCLSVQHLINSNHYVDGFASSFDTSYQELLALIQDENLGTVSDAPVYKNKTNAQVGNQGVTMAKGNIVLGAIIVVLLGVVGYFVLFPEQQRKEEWLAGVWRIQEYSSDLVIPPDSLAIYQQNIESFKRGFKLTLFDDKSFERIGFVDGGESGTWTLSADTRTLTLAAGGEAGGVLEIQEFERNKLVLKVKDAEATVLLTLVKGS